MEKIICKERQEKIKNNPLVTIITVCLNSEKYIKDTIESVLNQTYKNIEYIIIDGQSKDNTLNIIKEYEPKFEGRMKWISEPDKGIYDAMNKGIKMARGEIIGIINSDDWYEINTVEIVVKACQEMKKALIIITGALNLVRNNKEIIKIIFPDTKPLNKKEIFKYNLNHPATFVTKDVYKRVGLFDPTFLVAGDRDFLYRAIQNDYILFHNINKILTNFRIGGLSSEKGLKSIWLFTKEKYKVRKGRINFINNLLFCFRYFFISSLKNIIRSILGTSIMNKYYMKKYKYIPR